jgi:hypothetical protein
VGTLPVFIKSWVLKLLIVLGIVLPIAVPAIVMKQSDSVISVTWVRVILFPFSMGLILLPFTGLLRDIVKGLPKDFIFSRFASPRYWVNVDNYVDEGITPEEREKRATTFFGLNNYMFVTGFEYMSLGMGIVLFLAVILSLFVRT